MEAASRNDPCVQNLLQVVMQYAGAFAVFVVGKSADLVETWGASFSTNHLRNLTASL
jgi:hypothetical protein